MRYEDKRKEELIIEVIELRKEINRLKVSETMHKQYEETLKNYEYNFLTLIENTHELIYIAQNGMIKYANKKTIQTSGYSEEELISRPFTDFIHPDDRELVMLRHMQRLKGENPTNFYLYRFIDKYGNTIWMELYVTRIIWDGKPATLNFINDITEQKQTQEALRLSEERFYKAFKFNPAPMVITSLHDGRFIDVNDAMLNYLGYERNEVIGKTIKRMNVFVNEDNLEYILMCGINNNTISNMEIHLRIKSGKVHIGLLSTEIIDVAGEKCILGVVQDITERKQMEESLRLSEERFCKVFKSNPCIMFIKSLDNRRYIDVNDSWLNSMGFPRNEVIGQKSIGLKMYVNFDHVTSITEKNLGQGSISNVDINYYTKIGDERAGLLSTEILDVAGEKCILGVIQDITERKKMEVELRKANTKITNILESITDAFYAMDNNWTITYTNCAAEKVFSRINEIKKGSLVGKNKWEQFSLYVGTNLYHEYHRAMAEQVPVHFELISPYTKFYFEVYAYPSPEGLSVYFRDITERKNIEREMARLAKLNLIGEMAAGIAHEIRNPMTIVRGLLQLLGQNERYCLDKEHFNLMIEELDRANSIITEFLSLAKDKANNLETRNLNSIIKTMYPLINADAMNSGKEVQVQFGNIAELLLNEKEIRQLLLNLVRNGFESMDIGSCLIIKTYAKGKEVVLKVKDQGKGISPDVLDKIGTPFFTTKADGTGLGLATCYSIASRHNAIIDFDTGPYGTTFYVKFKISS